MLVGKISRDQTVTVLKLKVFKNLPITAKDNRIIFPSTVSGINGITTQKIPAKANEMIVVFFQP